MKGKVFIYVLSFMLLTTFGCDLTSKNDENTDNPNPDPVVEYDAYLLSFAIVKEGKEYPFEEGAGIVSGYMPYKTDMTKLVATFTVSEGAKVYVDDVEQISGETVNDFSTTKYYTIVSKDGKTDIVYEVSLWEAKNTEAKLYSMSVLVDSTEYPCTINGSVISVDFPTLYKADLYSTNLYFTVSDDATLHDGIWPTPMENGTTFNIGGYVGSIWFRVKAQNEINKSDYTFNVTCINCSK